VHNFIHPGERSAYINRSTVGERICEATGLPADIQNTRYTHHTPRANKPEAQRQADEQLHNRLVNFNRAHPPQRTQGSSNNGTPAGTSRKRRHNDGRDNVSLDMDDVHPYEPDSPEGPRISNRPRITTATALIAKKEASRTNTQWMQDNALSRQTMHLASEPVMPIPGPRLRSIDAESINEVTCPDDRTIMHRDRPELRNQRTINRTDGPPLPQKYTRTEKRNWVAWAARHGRTAAVISRNSDQPSLFKLIPSTGDGGVPPTRANIAATGSIPKEQTIQRYRSGMVPETPVLANSVVSAPDTGLGNENNDAGDEDFMDVDIAAQNNEQTRELMRVQNQLTSRYTNTTNVSTFACPPSRKVNKGFSSKTCAPETVEAEEIADNGTETGHLPESSLEVSPSPHPPPVRQVFRKFDRKTYDSEFFETETTAADDTNTGELPESGGIIDPSSEDNESGGAPV
jgi:hypothetical protein